ncbi:MAG: hypothetical protein CVU29_02655 [Betaproteobacteria bacterium HGW-Betaproteobacteria-22]|nr:MAG: hypothetical protein CVU29_02655 [Betaproteobacteria bacterium HGW-Betaproteobacteria-22]
MTDFSKTDPQIAGTLNETQTDRTLAQAQAIAAAAEIGAIKKEQFVFFAAFDGTRNDKKDVELSGNPEDTNVAQLYTQAFNASKTNANLRAGYYAGHGSEGTVLFSEALPIQVTKEALRTAETAYNQFAKQASDWLKEHPNGDVTTAITSFSRGGGTAAVFTQLLYQNGLIDPKTKAQLIPPGQVGVSAGVIFDPVTTGQDGNVAFAPNVKNIAVIRAENEYRYLFKAVDYAGQIGIHIFDATGNHCNIGGGYQKDGLGNLYLGAATEFLQKSGLGIADVDPSRRFEAGTKLTAYNESGMTREQAHSFFSEYKARGQWDVYSYFDPNTETQTKRLLDKAAQPAQMMQAEEGTQQKTFKLYNGQQMIESQSFGEKARTYLEESPEKAISRHPDLLGAFVLREITLKNIADMPTETQRQVLARFDLNVTANIERGNLPPAPNLNQPTYKVSWFNPDLNADAPSLAA